FFESPHSRCKRLPTPPHVHLGKPRQRRTERKPGVICLVIRIVEDGIGPPATRAKAPSFYRGVSAGLKTRSPGLNPGATPQIAIRRCRLHGPLPCNTTPATR